MGRGYSSWILIAALLTACNSVEPTPPPSEQEQEEHPGTVIYRTETTEWRVWIPYGSVYVYDSYPVDSPYHIPTHEEAKILRTLTYGGKDQRFLTDDGYTFGMPSASITKAGQKTKYSVLALWIRPTVIEVEF